jgi:two-component system, LytTR family, response regulator
LKLSAVIIDDEKPARRKIRHFLELDPEIEVIGECENGHEALDFIRKTPADLLFLDVQMPLIDGFALLKRSRSGRFAAVIFVTAYDEYAVKAFEANAVDYLLKPFTRRRFEEALRKVKQQIWQKRNSEPAEQAIAVIKKLQEENRYLQHLAIKSNHGIALLQCERVDWMETEDNYILVHSGNRTHLIRESMNAMEQALDPARFLRIHRRIIVNVDRIREIRQQGHSSLILQDGSVLPVSRRLKERVKRFLLKKRI